MGLPQLTSEQLAFLLSLPPKERIQYELNALGLRPYKFFVLVGITGGLTTICILLRFYVRLFILPWKYRKDDWMLLGAYLVFMADGVLYVVLAAITLREGLLGAMSELQQLALAATIVYLFDQIFIKLALAASLIPLVREGWLKRISILTISFYTTYTFAFTFAVLFACGTPGPRTLMIGKCLPWDTVLGPLNYVAAALNAIVDWVLTLAPILTVYRLDMDRHQKTAVYSLMSLGLVASLASIIRFPFLRGVNPTGDLSFFKNVIPISIVSLAESAIGVIALSSTALRPLFAKRRGSDKTTMDSTHLSFVCKSMQESSVTASEIASKGTRSVVASPLTVPTYSPPATPEPTMIQLRSGPNHLRNDIITPTRADTALYRALSDRPRPDYNKPLPPIITDMLEERYSSHLADLAQSSNTTRGALRGLPLVFLDEDAEAQWSEDSRQDAVMVLFRRTQPRVI